MHCGATGAGKITSDLRDKTDSHDIFRDTAIKIPEVLQPLIFFSLTAE